MTGIEYRTITVGTHENLVVRFSLAAQLLMKRRKVDPAKISEAIGAITIPNPNLRLQSDPPTIKVANPKGLENALTIFSCMVAENFFDKALPHNLDLSTAPTADYWATQIEDFPAIEKVIWDSLGKVAEAQKKKLALVPPTETEAAS